MPRKKRTPAELQRVWEQKLLRYGKEYKPIPERDGRLRRSEKDLQFKEEILADPDSDLESETGVQHPERRGKRPRYVTVDLPPPDVENEFQVRREAIGRACGILRVSRRRVATIARWVDQSCGDEGYKDYLFFWYREFLNDMAQDHLVTGNVHLKLPVRGEPNPNRNTAMLSFSGKFLDVALIVASVLSLDCCWNSWFWKRRFPKVLGRTSRKSGYQPTVSDKTIALIYLASQSNTLLPKTKTL